MRFGKFYPVLLFLVLFSIFVSGCRSGSALKMTAEDELIQWPPPPEPPRVQFVTAFSSASDLGIGGGLFSRLLGKQQQNFLRRPVAVAVNDVGRIYVADLAGVVYFFDPSRKKTRRQEKGIGEQLVSPVSLTIGEGDSIFVVDSILRKVIVYNRDLDPVRVFASEFERPAGIFWERTLASFFIADAGANRIKIYDMDGHHLSSIGLKDGDQAEFNTPTHLWASGGNIYVTDAFNFQVKKMTPDGQVQAQIGRLGNATGSFARPKGVATDASGHLYVVDALFGNVQIFSDQGELLLFFGTSGEFGPGSLCLPNGIFIDSNNRIYLTDTYHGSIQVFQYLEGPGGSP